MFKLIEIISKILTIAHEWEYTSDNTKMNDEKSMVARASLKYVIEAYAEILPPVEKTLPVADRLKPNELSFSLSKKCRKEVDFKFDILSLSHVSHNGVKLYQDDFNQGNSKYIHAGAYKFAVRADRQIIYLNNGYSEIELLGRFAEFDICSVDSNQEILDLPIRYIDPIIKIAGYEFAKSINKMSVLEALKATRNEAIDQLKKIRL